MKTKAGQQALKLYSKQMRNVTKDLETLANQLNKLSPKAATYISDFKTLIRQAKRKFEQLNKLQENINFTIKLESLLIDNKKQIKWK